jgi:molybdate/tungstate transport system substrate-binding protein
MRKIFPFLFVILIFFAFSCNTAVDSKEEILDSNIVQGSLIVFHDELMDSAVKDLARLFEEEYPHVKVVDKSGGSRKYSQKIVNHNKDCDIFISSDFKVIKNMLMPTKAKWFLEFANDELVIAYTSHSSYADSISSENWYRILLSNKVHFGRCDPDNAPIGYRTVLCIKLAEKYYGQEGIKDQLLFKDKKFIKASEMEVISKLQKQKIDYLFTYKSVAIEKQLKFIELPEQISLKSKAYESYYAMVSMKVSANNPGEYIIQHGAPIRFGLCQINDSPNPNAAEAFLRFFMQKNHGIEVFQKNGIENQDSLMFVPLDSVSVDLREEFGI